MMRGNSYKYIGLIALSLALAACGSSVKLNDVPVEDRSAASSAAADAAAARAAAQGSSSSISNAGASAGASAGGVQSRAVVPVELTPRNAPAAAPTQLARVIYFDFDSFVIRPEGEAVIESHARFLSTNKSRTIAVEGHTDERGGREYNLALGQKRAEAVRRRLVLLGVGEGQVEAVSFGKEKPAASGADEASFEKNRRAEITYR
jgi:peptidoglycan-associated lipoprotein